MFEWERRFVVSTEPATTELLRALASVLARFGGRWYLFGAQAVLVWGRPRLTGDVDVTIFLDPEDPPAFVTAMQESGFDLRVRNVEDFVSRTRVFPFTHVASGLALDAVLGTPNMGSADVPRWMAERYPSGSSRNPEDFARPPTRNDENPATHTA
jgi:hypothetical protein